MKILLVSGHIRNWDAGASTVYLHLDEALRTLGHDCRLLNAEDYLPVKMRNIVHKLAASTWVRRVALPLAQEMDVVEVAGNIGWQLFRSLWALPRGKRPLLVTRLHGLEFKDEQARIDEEIARQLTLSRKYKLITRHWTNWQEFRTLSLADVALCYTTRDTDAIVATRLKSETQVRTVPAGVDTRFFSPARHVSAYLSPCPILWWGTWIERKGISALPRAFELACREQPDLTLTLGGTGRTPEQILSEFSSEVRSRVQVLPFVTREAHLDVLRSHEIFVFPSLSEGFGLALLEAMAAEMACITTFTGIAYDWLEHNQNAWLVPMSAPTALARALVRLSREPALRQRLGQKAKETAQRLTWPNFAEQTVQVYNAFRADSENQPETIFSTTHV